MLRAPRQSLLVSTVAFTLAAGSPEAHSAEPLSTASPPASPACSLSVVPGAVTGGRPDTRLLVEATKDFSSTPTAEAASGSGIEIRDLLPDVSADSWVLRLDLSEANAGLWRITLENETVECIGHIRIREAIGGSVAKPRTSSTTAGRVAPGSGDGLPRTR